jgi:hypothetical protein
MYSSDIIMCAEALMRLRLSGCGKSGCGKNDKKSDKIVFIEKTFGNMTKSPMNRSERYERRCKKKDSKDK